MRGSAVKAASQDRLIEEIEQQRIRHMREIAPMVALLLAIFVPLIVIGARHVFSTFGLIVLAATGLTTALLSLLARHEAILGRPRRAGFMMCAAITAFIMAVSLANPPPIIGPTFLALPILIAALAFKPHEVKLMAVFQSIMATIMYVVGGIPEDLPAVVMLLEYVAYYALVTALALGSVRGHGVVFTQLDEARREAELASAAKSQFLANMSHELRTPLNAIIGYAELMQEELEEASPDELSGDLQNIQSSGRYLLALISDVLDLSRIESNRFDLHITQAPIGTLLEALHPIGQTLCAQRLNSFTIEHNATIDALLVRTDQTVLRQILLNLLSNAAKFTERGSVTLRVSQPDATHIRFEVIDTGAGIPADALERIFGEFEQVRGAHQESLKGTGLGLSLVRRLSALLGGTVSVESVVGQGSTFSITLPDQLPMSEPEPR